MEKAQLKSLLKFYFEKGFDDWSYDNTAEVHGIVDLIETMIERKAKEVVVDVLEKGIEVCKEQPTETEEEVAFRVLMREAWVLAGRPDDAGCDWCTDEEGNTYIGDWKASSDPRVAQLVETAYWIRFKEDVRHTREQIERD